MNDSTISSPGAEAQHVFDAAAMEAEEFVAEFDRPS
jgi:hypothetical protein